MNINPYAKTVLTIFICFLIQPVAAEMKFPGNVAPICTVSETTFDTWFDSNSVTTDGKVVVADSLNFTPSVSNPNCDFYKWSWQMFLWSLSTNELTDKLTFQGDGFYNVSGNTELTDNSQIEVRVEKLSRLDQASSRAVLMSRSFHYNVNESLVYYGVHVNDVFAYFSLGQQASKIVATDFPTTEDELLAVENYANQLNEHQRTVFPDRKALAVELKTSWVRADAVEDISKYITMLEFVPKYVKSESDPKTEWTWDGTSVELAQLALVGVHVVGSTKDHPEMIWATFESRYNAPGNRYEYTIESNSSDNTSELKVTGVVNEFKPIWNKDLIPVDDDWLLYAPKGLKSRANIEKMTLETTPGTTAQAIVATDNQKISRSDAYRTHPWGSRDGDIENNTNIVSLNQNILAQLKKDDIRRNYALIGATWTKDGSIPNKMPDSNIQGSALLSNMTMETYTQDTLQPVNKQGCFGCHNLSGFDAKKDVRMDFLSHNFRVKWPELL